MEGQGLAMGVLGSPDGLRLLSSRALSQAVDDALDRTALRRALLVERSGGAAAGLEKASPLAAHPIRATGSPLSSPNEM